MVLDQSGMNVSISALVRDFHTTAPVIQAVITVYWAARIDGLAGKVTMRYGIGQRPCGVPEVCMACGLRR